MSSGANFTSHESDIVPRVLNTNYTRACNVIQPSFEISGPRSPISSFFEILSTHSSYDRAHVSLSRQTTHESDPASLTFWILEIKSDLCHSFLDLENRFELKSNFIHSRVFSSAQMEVMEKNFVLFFVSYSSILHSQQPICLRHVFFFFFQSINLGFGESPRTDLFWR